MSSTVLGAVGNGITGTSVAVIRTEGREELTLKVTVPRGDVRKTFNLELRPEELHAVARGILAAMEVR